MNWWREPDELKKRTWLNSSVRSDEKTCQFAFWRNAGLGKQTTVRFCELQQRIRRNKFKRQTIKTLLERETHLMPSDEICSEMTKFVKLHVICKHQTVDWHSLHFYRGSSIYDVNKTFRFLTPLSPVHMSQAPSPLVQSTWNTHRSLETASTMTFRTWSWNSTTWLKPI